MPSINNNLISVNTTAKSVNTGSSAIQSTVQESPGGLFNQHLSDELNKANDFVAQDGLSDQQLLFDALNDLDALQEADNSLQTGNELPLEEMAEALLSVADEDSSAVNSELVASNDAQIASLTAMDDTDQTVLVSAELATALPDETAEASAGEVMPLISVSDQISHQPQRFVNAAILSAERLKAEVSTLNQNTKSKPAESALQAVAESSDSGLSDLTANIEPDEADLPESGLQKQSVPNQLSSQPAAAQTNVKSEIISSELASTRTPVSVQSNIIAADSSKLPSDSFSMQHEVMTPVGQKQWGAEFSQRVSLMINNGQQQVAELRLNPAHLGPVSVRLQLDDDKASLSFLTHQSSVKDAIEQSLPKLREQLQQQGLDLGHVDVSHQETNDSSAESSFGDSSTQYSDAVSAQEEIVTEQIVNIDVSDGVSIFV
ncbi:MAG: flagellar hook-length control protein FliK [Gammaproteobacteria bacterium]|nr:flagellar hook-length control protein FliK [Gammaproteobacteria bacterium]